MIRPELLATWEPYAASCCEGYNAQEGHCYTCGWDSTRMEPSSVLVVFRGRNTAAIEMDAVAYLGSRIDVESAATAVICREDDALAESGDLTAAGFVSVLHWLCKKKDTPIFVVANGGTTQQLLGVISGLRAAGRQFVAMDCQREAITEYAL